jgi:hypothetical protein
MSPFDRFVRLFPPFPPVAPVAAPCGSPAVPHLHRYYEVVRLLQHPSALPPVDPWLHVPPVPFQRRSSWHERRWGALFGSWIIPVELALVYDTADPSTTSRYRSLPDTAVHLGKGVGVGTTHDFGAQSSRPASLLSTLRTPRSPGEWQDSLLSCLLDFAQGRDRARARQR